MTIATWYLLGARQHCKDQGDYLKNDYSPWYLLGARQYGREQGNNLKSYYSYLVPGSSTIFHHLIVTQMAGTMTMFFQFKSSV